MHVLKARNVLSSVLKCSRITYILFFGCFVRISDNSDYRVDVRTSRTIWVRGRTMIKE